MTSLQMETETQFLRNPPENQFNFRPKMSDGLSQWLRSRLLSVWCFRAIFLNGLLPHHTNFEFHQCFFALKFTSSVNNHQSYILRDVIKYLVRWDAFLVGFYRHF